MPPFLPAILGTIWRLQLSADTWLAFQTWTIATQLHAGPPGFLTRNLVMVLGGQDDDGSLPLPSVDVKNVPDGVKGNRTLGQGFHDAREAVTIILTPIIPRFKATGRVSRL